MIRARKFFLRVFGLVILLCAVVYLHPQFIFKHVTPNRVLSLPPDSAGQPSLSSSLDRDMRSSFVKQHVKNRNKIFALNKEGDDVVKGLRAKQLRNGERGVQVGRGTDADGSMQGKEHGPRRMRPSMCVRSFLGAQTQHLTTVLLKSTIRTATFVSRYVFRAVFVEGLVATLHLLPQTRQSPEWMEVSIAMCAV